ncbi:winged helix-turn-helix domain-containing protein [Martelella alba]|uniref:OmpR/PhoB-type domain-containing protein n=1 Tax=Martelella alba TaxID=2590451 RepID=A0ABY2SLD8_9HYPH|nr:winged helix-turn-helix domain-containing protein [Martelella alba]TKI06542.1 hypothetical protein FCN80_09835 [Martelella alba]
MKYLFNHSVLFDTTEYQLYLLKDGRSAIRLSNTAGRVLQELILSRGTGVAVSREQLFEQVWIKQGLQPSNGNLNQQISLIRKAFATLGLEPNAIVTLPKRGLKLNDHLLVAPVGPLPSSPPAPSGGAISPHAADPDAPPPTADPDGQASPTAADAAAQISPAPSGKPLGLKILTAATLAVALAALLPLDIYWFKKDKLPLFFFEKIHSCNVYTFRPVNDHEKPAMNEQMEKTLQGRIERCNKHQLLLFSYNIINNVSVRNNANQQVFLAKCDKDARGNISGCLNFYFYNWD